MLLTDAQMAKLKVDALYKKCTSVGLRGMATDILRNGEGDFKPEVSAIRKILSLFGRARIVRKELQQTTLDLLERMLNRDLAWSRKPGNVEVLCDSDQGGFLWMRYDVARVRPLFLRGIHIMSDPRVRSIVKSYSSLSDTEANAALSQILADLEMLADSTIDSIETRGACDKILDIRKRHFYKCHEEEMQRRFLEGIGNSQIAPGYQSDGAVLGPLPVASLLGPPVVGESSVHDREQDGDDPGAVIGETGSRHASHDQAERGTATDCARGRKTQLLCQEDGLPRQPTEETRAKGSMPPPCE